MHKNSHSYLKRLIGQTIKNITTDMSTIVPIKNDKAESMEQVMSVYIQIYFDEYRLHVFNTAETIGS